MMNSLTAAQASHVFLYRGWEVKSAGNPLAHAILRGAVDPLGRTLPNYHYEDLITLYDLYQKKNYQNPAVIVDANHANSGKKVYGTDPYLQRSPAQLPPQQGNRIAGQGLYDRKLY